MWDEDAFCICAVAPQITKSVTCPDELGALASQVTGDYSQLAVQGRLAAHTAEPEEVRMSTKTWSDAMVCPILPSQQWWLVLMTCSSHVFRFFPISFNVIYQETFTSIQILATHQSTLTIFEFCTNSPSSLRFRS